MAGGCSLFSPKDSPGYRQWRLSGQSHLGLSFEVLVLFLISPPLHETLKLVSASMGA